MLRKMFCLKIVQIHCTALVLNFDLDIVVFELDLDIVVYWIELRTLDAVGVNVSGKNLTKFNYKNETQQILGFSFE